MSKSTLRSFSIYFAIGFTLLNFLGCSTGQRGQARLTDADIQKLCSEVGTYKAEYWVKSELSGQKSASLPASFLAREDGSWTFQGQDLWGGELMTVTYGKGALDIRSYISSIPTQVISVSEAAMRLPRELSWIGHVREEFPVWLRGAVTCGLKGGLSSESGMVRSSLEGQECSSSKGDRMCLTSFETKQGLRVHYDSFDDETAIPMHMELKGRFGKIIFQTKRFNWKPKLPENPN